MEEERREKMNDVATLPNTYVASKDIYLKEG